MKIAILIACHNRAPVTLAGIGALKAALARLQSVEPTFFVVDDKSSDQTFEQVRQAFPDVRIAQGTGGLYWAGGMSRAYELARQTGRYDAYLMFNDDVVVDAAALAQFFAEYREVNEHGPGILAAATRSAADGSITYSAMRRLSKLRPLRVQRIEPNGAIQVCDTFNGNFVLVPGPFFESVGGLDTRFVHSYADIDLGYVAGRAGVARFLASTPVGTCEAHPASVANVRGIAALLEALGTPPVKQDSLRQRAHFIYKNAPLPFSLGVAAVSTLRMIAGRAATRL